MAALVNSYQPEGRSFSQHYADGMSGSYAEDPEDEVKSKPRLKKNSEGYAPLINQNPPGPEERERHRSYGGVISTYRSSQVNQPDISESDNTYCRSYSCPLEDSLNLNLSTDLDEIVKSKIPATVNLQSSPTSTDPNHGNGGVKEADSDFKVGDDNLVKVDLGADSLASPVRRISTSQTESENEQETGQDGCTVALLADYQKGGKSVVRPSRLSSVSLGLPRDFLCSPGGLVEVLAVGHRKCSVSLEDECISWQILSRKSCEWLNI